MNSTMHAHARGFSILEALIALVLVAFGLLTLMGVTMKLARSEDVARQRGEAARLAQERIEAIRSYTQIDTSATTLAWADLASGNDSIVNSDDYSTNTTFNRSWQLLGATTDPMRQLRVTVNWLDRTNTAQTLSYGTVISQTDPKDVGSLGFPLPANTTLKRPKNRCQKSTQLTGMSSWSGQQTNWPRSMTADCPTDSCAVMQ